VIGPSAGIDELRGGDRELKRAEMNRFAVGIPGIERSVAGLILFGRKGSNRRRDGSELRWRY